MLTVAMLAGSAMALLAAGAAGLLGWASRALAVEEDPRIDRVLALLPGSNCGACGYAGCREYANAVVHGDAPPGRCPNGGSTCARSVAESLGIEVGDFLPYRAVVRCHGDADDRLGRWPYRGEPTCAAASVVPGVQGCVFGCLGFGDCVQACDFGALSLDNGLARVDPELCVGCGCCESACPRELIALEPVKGGSALAVRCSNPDFGKQVTSVCKVGCTGCGKCARECTLYQMDGHLPVLDYADLRPEEDHEALAAAARCCPAGCLDAPSQPDETGTVASPMAAG